MTSKTKNDNGDVDHTQHSTIQKFEPNKSIEKIANALGGVYWVSDFDLNLLYISPSADKLLEVSSEELLGISWNEIIHPDDKASFISALESKQDQTLEYRLKTNHGNYTWVSHALTFEADFATGIIQDISKSKELKEEIDLLFRSTQEPFLIVDKSLDIITFNKEFGQLYLKYFGIDVNKGDCVLNYSRTQQREVLKSLYEQVFQGKTHESIVSFPFEGEEKNIKINYSPMTNKNGEILGAFVTAVDITESKRIEDKLKKNERHFRALVENSSDSVVILKQDGSPKYVSPSIKSVLGYTEEEAYKMNLFDVAHPEDIPHIQKEMMEVLNNPGNPISGTLTRVRNKEGEWRWMESTVTNMFHDPIIEGIVYNFRDITARVKSQDKLKESEENYRDLFNLSPLSKVIYRLNDLKILHVNVQALQQYGYSREEFSELTILDIRPEEEIPTVLKLHEEIKRGSGIFRFGEHRHMNKAGEILHMDISAQKTIYRGEECVIVVCHNVSDSVIIQQTERLEQELTEETIKTDSDVDNLIYKYLKGLETIHSGLITSILKVRDGKVWDYLSPSLPNEFRRQVNGAPIGPVAGSCGTAAFLQKRIVVSNIETDPFWVNYRGLANQFDLKACWSEPIFNSEGEVIATFANYYKHAKSPTQNELETFGRSAPLLSIILENYQKRKELTLSNERYDFVNQATNDAIYDWDAMINEVHWGSGFERAFGHDGNREDFTVEDWFSLIHPEDQEVVDRELQKFLATKNQEVWEANYRLRKSDSTYAYVEEKGFAIRNRHGEVYRMIGAIRDVTVQRKVKQLLDNASSLAAIGGWEYDVINDSVTWSEIAKEIFEVDQEYLPSYSTAFNFFPEHFKEKMASIVENSITEGTSFDIEFPIITQKGNERWVRAMGIPEMENDQCVRLVGSVQNIHFRKIAQLELARKSEYLVSIADITAIFLQNRGWEETLEETFEIIGSALNVNRIAYFEIDDPKNKTDFIFEQKYRWTTSDGFKQLPFIPKQSLKPFLDELSPMLDGHHVDMERDKLRNAKLKRLLKKNQINSMLLIPIHIKDNFYGFVALEDSTQVRTWKKDETSFLHSVISNFSVAIERRQSQFALKEAFAEKNQILESIDDAFFAVDKSFVITYWNRMAERMSKVPRSKILGKNLWDVFKKEDFPLSFYNFSNAMDEMKTIQFQDYFPQINTWFEINVYPSQSGLTAYLKNITDKKLAEEQLKESNERFEKVAIATNDAIWDWDMLSGKVYRTGQGFCNLFGYDNNEANENDAFWRERVHPEDIEEVTASQLSTLKDKSLLYWEHEYRFLKKSGEYAYVYDRGHIVRDKRGKAIRMIGATQDITQRKEHEASLTRLNHELEQRAKELTISNTELEQFAYVASHDLQEPLRMVTSFLTQLEKRYSADLDERAQQYIHFAVDGASRMRQIILDLLEFSRVGKHDDKLSLINLNEIVDEVCQLQWSKIEETDAIIEFENLPTVISYKLPMVQILQNLIGNGLKYQKKDTQPRIQIKAKEDALQWHISVQDNGIGIEKQYFDRIFVIFQRLHNRDEFSGTGMGLAIVKKIVENLGGTLWVESQPGEGSTFHFTLLKQHEPEPTTT